MERIILGHTERIVDLQTIICEWTKIDNMWDKTHNPELETKQMFTFIMRVREEGSTALVCFDDWATCYICYDDEVFYK